jgi:predicted nucleic acid-binding protein
VKAFFDTNILIYAITEDARGVVARARLRDGGAASTRVLNEFVRVAREKLKLDWTKVETALRDFRGLVGPIRGIVVSTHEAAVALARDHGLDIYDTLIVASALEAGCDTLWTEDMQDGRVFEGLTIRNPFRQGQP